MGIDESGPTGGRGRSGTVGDSCGDGGTEYSGPVGVTAYRFGGHDPAGPAGGPGSAAGGSGRAGLESAGRLHAVLGLSLAGRRTCWPRRWRGSTGRRAAGAPLSLEIGCGLGLAGLVALARGCGCRSAITTGRRWISWRARQPRTVRPAIVRTRLLDWRDLPDERFPVILGADVIYEARLVPLVADVLAAMLAPGGVGLIASPYRVADEDFPAAVESRGLACRPRPRPHGPRTAGRSPGRSIGWRHDDAQRIACFCPAAGVAQPPKYASKSLRPILHRDTISTVCPLQWTWPLRARSRIDRIMPLDVSSAHPALVQGRTAKLTCVAANSPIVSRAARLASLAFSYSVVVVTWKVSWSSRPQEKQRYGCVELQMDEGDEDFHQHA